MRILKYLDIVEAVTQRKANSRDHLYDFIYCYPKYNHRNIGADDSGHIYTQLGYWSNKGEIYRFQENINFSYKKLTKAKQETSDYFSECREDIVGIYGLMRSLLKEEEVDTNKYGKSVFKIDHIKLSIDSDRYMSIYIKATKYEYKHVDIKYNRLALKLVREYLTKQVTKLVASNHGIEIDRLV